MKDLGMKDQIMDTNTLTPSEIINILTSDDLRIKVRKIFSKWSARIDQCAMQEVGPIELRRMEVLAAEEIIKTVAEEIMVKPEVNDEH